MTRNTIPALFVIATTALTGTASAETAATKTMDHSKMDHSKMDMPKPEAADAGKPKAKAKTVATAKDKANK